ncbi:MAG: glycosyltransferase [Candidatus Moranbacteria bacterium]|nr:glycosyltransferase [Candidatus Moranbacteria bacterium]
MKSLLVKFGKARLILERNGWWGGARIIAGYLRTFIKAFFVGSGDVLFISSGVGDSAYYRAYNPAEELRIHGFKTATTISDNPNLEKLADKFKVFVFHRTMWNKNIEKIIRKIKERGKEIIFDTDDLVYDPQYLVHMDYFQKMGPAEQEQYKNGIGAEIVNDPYVKTCTTTVSYLGDKLKEKGKKVIIVPNKFSDHELEVADKLLEKEKTSDGFVRLGYYSGTLSHNKDFASITDALMSVLGKYGNVKLLLAGSLDVEDKLNEFGARIETLPRVPRDEYYGNVYKCDINLAPLELGNPFCESKSAIKFTEAGILEIPTVAVKNQTFSETIEDGTDGFLAGDTGEWVEKIGRLVEDKELRVAMGKKAREKVLKRYTNKASQNEEYYGYIRDVISK